MVCPILDEPGGESTHSIESRVVYSFGRIRLFAPAALQTKLAIDKPGDVYEQEADRVAERVMRMAPAAVVRQGEKAEPKIQRLAQGVGGAGEVASNFASRLGAGAPLDASSRSYFEPRFLHDFSRVRVHTDSNAGESARSLDALAYTLGSDIVFGAGQVRSGDCVRTPAARPRINPRRPAIPGSRPPRPAQGFLGERSGASSAASSISQSTTATRRSENISICSRKPERSKGTPTATTRRVRSSATRNTSLSPSRSGPCS